MHLRWRLAVVTGAGGGLGREIAVRLGRVGAGVLVTDRDGGAAEETAALVRACRVSAWSMSVDPRDDVDLRLLVQRAQDLGGADLLVHAPTADPDPLLTHFLDGLVHRRGPRVEPGAAVLVGAGSAPRTDPDLARVTRVAPGPAADDRTVAVTVLRLLSDGEPGAVVELPNRPADSTGGPGSP